MHFTLYKGQIFFKIKLNRCHIFFLFFKFLLLTQKKKFQKTRPVNFNKKYDFAKINSIHYTKIHAKVFRQNLDIEHTYILHLILVYEFAKTFRLQLN